ncbi:MAG TPA: type II toxin-antitoxin system RelE/ParE family toxin [Gemmatimonadaceae bacterium]|nr:type II toxin-antitoxin system RelE/ParE family toxin [Gemmatimonadaceae bacterium]
MRVVWTQLARDRLDEIFDFIGANSALRAAEFCERLIDAVDQLKVHPFSGPVLPEDPAYRQLVVDEYRIAYRVGEDVVSIHTIVAPGMTYEHAL